MARHQDKLKNLTRCKYAFRKQLKQIELVEDLCIQAQDTLFALSFDTSFYKFDNGTRVYATNYNEHKVSILINDYSISFDLGNKHAISKELDKCKDKDFEDFIRKVRDLYD